jgi:hypothetical protein
MMSAATAAFSDSRHECPRRLRQPGAHSLAIQGQITRIQNRVTAIEIEKRRLIDLYAEDELPEAAYVDGNVTLDQAAAGHDLT